ncbi:MAG: aldo/keto reductase [Gemmatimonadaceae bacterium]|jgi:aryl-alcohol dehydrogenase-like predicted oxidoreductase
MNTSSFGRLGWPVAPLGYGMWGLANWSGTDADEVGAALDAAVAAGITFFDTAWGYGRGASERILGTLLRAHPERRLFTATKIPPKNMAWPSRREFTLDDCFPPDHIRAYAEKSLENLGLPRIDLLQFHVWEDGWARDERWQRAMDDLRREGLIAAVGVSVNRWEPWNCLDTLRTGLVDAVQVIYNVFDQAPEDELFPLCQQLDIAVIARVPFDEGSLAGQLRADSTFPEGDFRRIYFGPENLGPTVARVEALRAALPADRPLAEAALRFAISHPAVHTVIPGMRRPAHVRANVDAVTRGALASPDIALLRAHRWDRTPAAWSL